ncbi:MAG: hypothetical protein ACRD3N_17320 [Terracidiphilus sp.]
MTTEDLKRLTVDDVIRLKLTEDEMARLREINRNREREREDRVKQMQIEQAPLMRELAEAGVVYSTLGQMMNSPGPYKDAIPILLAHLEKPYSVPTRATIARCLAVYDAIYAWPKFVELYRAEPCTERYADGIKSDLAVAVAATTTEENIPTLIELARDRSNGSSRLHFLRKLRRSKNPLAKQALMDLATDPDLEKEIASWRRRRSSRS